MITVPNPEIVVNYCSLFNSVNSKVATIHRNPKMTFYIHSDRLEPIKPILRPVQSYPAPVKPFTSLSCFLFHFIFLLNLNSCQAHSLSSPIFIFAFRVLRQISTPTSQLRTSPDRTQKQQDSSRTSGRKASCMP